jgi:hypothetical protein
LLSQTSVYTTGSLTVPLEGIYIRVDDDTTGFLKYRAKVVRSDFIQTVDDSSHWSTQTVVKNEVDYEWKTQIDYHDDYDTTIHNGGAPVITVANTNVTTNKKKKK